MSSLLWMVLGLVLSAQSAGSAPQSLIRDAIDAMGGESRLKGLHAVKLEAIGHTYWIDQSERPEGPWVTQYEQRTEIRDLTAGRLRQTIETRDGQSPAWTASTVIVSDQAAAIVAANGLRPGRAQQVDEAAVALELSPERLLLTMSAAADLRAAPDEVLQDVRQHVLQCSWRGAQVRLFLNAYTLLPTAIDLIRDDPRATWGEVTQRTLLSYWSLESNGLLYPHQWNVLWNGTPQLELTVTSLTPNPPIEPDTFAIPADVREAFARAPRTTGRTTKLGQGGQPPQTLADGVVLFLGSYNVTLVSQPDGVVIIEAPISSEYSAQVLDEASRRFPGVPVKAVISTSDAWTHLGGLREYVARGIPVYALDLNTPIIGRLLHARFRAAPDRLETMGASAASGPQPQLRPIADKTVIGEGPNQLVVYPVHGENGERMLMVHLPQRRLLYTSDEVIKRRSGEYFMPSFLVEITESVRRAGITGVDTAFGMHLAPTPWAEIVAMVHRLRPSDTAAAGPQ